MKGPKYYLEFGAHAELWLQSLIAELEKREWGQNPGLGEPLGLSGSLSCGAREVRSPCAWRGGARERLPEILVVPREKTPTGAAPVSLAPTMSREQ